MNKTLPQSIFLVAILLVTTQCQKSQEKATEGLPAITSTRAQKTTDPTAVEVKLSGEYLKAFLAAYSAFTADAGIPADKRKIENYTIQFEQNEKYYLISFFAKRLPSESELDGGESQLGKDATYAIDKQTFQFFQRGFYK